MDISPELCLGRHSLAQSDQSYDALVQTQTYYHVTNAKLRGFMLLLLLLYYWGLSLRWLRVARASDLPVPCGHRAFVLF